MYTLRLTISCAILIAASVSSNADPALGRVEGTLMLGGRPIGGAVITLEPQPPDPALSKQTNTVTHGAFVFENVPPGEYSVGLLKSFVERRSQGITTVSTATHTRHVFVEPGKTASVTIGGTGRKLTGKMVAPKDCTVEIDWQCNDFHHIYSSIQPKRPPEGLSETEKEAWWGEFKASIEYKKQKSSYTRIMLDVEKDGVFSAIDVPPGRYTIDIDVGEKGNCSASFPKRVGQLITTFDVPQSDLAEPFDLGEMEISLVTKEAKAQTESK